MTAIPAGAHVTVPRTRQARREVAAYRFEGRQAVNPLGVPWMVAILGIGLLALTIFNVVLMLIELA